jgi:indolepyruvate decarboxylase
MAFPTDYAVAPVIGGAQPRPEPKSDPGALAAARDAILAALSKAETACVLPGYFVSRIGLTAQVRDLITTSSLPFATMLWDKSVLDETMPEYVGMYDGALMNEDVRAFVEGSDLVIGIGAMLTDFNSGSFTAKIERSKSISIQHHSVRVGEAVFNDVEMKDILAELVKRIERKIINAPKALGLGRPVGKPDDPITAGYLYARWEKMLKEDDVLVTETGTSSMGLAFAKMPKGSTFYNETLWGSIGWATPAAFGAALASPGKRLILVTGEGSHQLTAQEVGQFHRFGLKPTIFVLNNDGYLIERLLCKDPESYYNDVARWHYHKLPEALGCDGWLTMRVTTCGELDEAIKSAESCGTGVYVEVVTDKYAASPLAQKLHESLATLYA